MQYRHIRTGRRYTVFDRNAQMKHPETGLWLACVVYGIVAQGDSHTYIRELEDFEAKFEKVT